MYMNQMKLNHKMYKVILNRIIIGIELNALEGTSYEYALKARIKLLIQILIVMNTNTSTLA